VLLICLTSLDRHDTKETLEGIGNEAQQGMEFTKKWLEEIAEEKKDLEKKLAAAKLIIEASKEDPYSFPSVDFLIRMRESEAKEEKDPHPHRPPIIRERVPNILPEYGNDDTEEEQVHRIKSLASQLNQELRSSISMRDSLQSSISSVLKHVKELKDSVWTTNRVPY